MKSELDFAKEAYERGFATYYMSENSKFNHMGTTMWLEVPLDEVPRKPAPYNMTWMKALAKKWMKDERGRRWYHFYGGSIRA